MVARGHDPVMEAVLAGLLLRPGLADAHHDALAALRPADAGDAAVLGAVLAMTAADHSLESAALLAHLADIGLAAEADRIRRGNGLRLSFTRAETPATVANADFAMTLAQATARAGLVEALAEATIRFQSSLDEADWAAQQERRQEIEALDAAMMALAESRREG